MKGFTNALLNFGAAAARAVPTGTLVRLLDPDAVADTLRAACNDLQVDITCHEFNTKVCHVVDVAHDEINRRIPTSAAAVVNHAPSVPVDTSHGTSEVEISLAIEMMQEEVDRAIADRTEISPWTVGPLIAKLRDALKLVDEMSETALNHLADLANLKFSGAHRDLHDLTKRISELKIVRVPRQ